MIIPIHVADETKNALLQSKVQEIANCLEAHNVRVHVDARRHIRPGPKFFEWERKGVPIRLEVGLRDLGSSSVTMSRRVGNSVKSSVSIEDLPATVVATLQDMQSQLLEAAQARLHEKIFKLSTYAEMKSYLEQAAQGNLGQSGFYLVPWHADDDNERAIKEDCKATIRCYPTFANSENTAADLKNATCFYSGLPATHFALFARAF